jgi:hypothetical protein
LHLAAAYLIIIFIVVLVVVFDPAPRLLSSALRRRHNAFMRTRITRRVDVVSTFETIPNEKVFMSRPKGEITTLLAAVAPLAMRVVTHGG